MSDYPFGFSNPGDDPDRKKDGPGQGPGNDPFGFGAGGFDPA